MAVTLDFSKAQPLPQPVTLDFSKAQPIPAATAPAPAQQEGFFRSLGDTLGVPQQMPTVGQAIGAAIAGPVVPLAKSLYEQGKASFDQLRQANQARKQGNTAGVIQHVVTAVPIIGPGLDKATDQYAAGNYTGEAGTLLGTAAQAAPVALGAADAALPGRPVIPNPTIPTRAAAGQIFNKLNTQLAQQPVELKTAAAPLQRAIEIAARGGTMPGPVNALLTRAQAIEPMTFPEARDYQASLSDLSASDKMAMNDRMKGAVAQLNHALYQDIRQAAENGGGLGSDFDKAMTQYKRASQFNNAARAALKYGGKAALGAAGAGGVYQIGKVINDR